MKITTFNNQTGLIFGSDPKRISCEKSGVLSICNTEINIAADTDEIMPMLCNGGTGDYDATFTDEHGVTYKLSSVTVRNGRIEAPSQMEVDIMELRLKAEGYERDIADLKAQIQELRNIFDTDSLNFLIR
jgi:hypothetical protein